MDSIVSVCVRAIFFGPVLPEIVYRAAAGPLFSAPEYTILCNSKRAYGSDIYRNFFA